MEGILDKVLSRKPPKILSKAENYALYEAGLFGNKALTWNSYEEILKSGWHGGICMRSKKGVARKEVRYNIPLEDVPKHIEQFNKIGISEEMISFNQSMPDEHLILQGEVMKYEMEFYLAYTTIKEPMNKALAAETRYAEGFLAKKLITENVTQESLYEFQKLFGLFPTSVVEFSAYAIPVGTLAHLNRNTVFWEVRNY
ncbi:MAG: hypothetical protein AABX28_02715 [Nanoarchaeota archaeon]